MKLLFSTGNKHFPEEFFIQGNSKVYSHSHTKFDRIYDTLFIQSLREILRGQIPIKQTALKKLKDDFGNKSLEK